MRLWSAAYSAISVAGALLLADCGSTPLGAGSAGGRGGRALGDEKRAAPVATSEPVTPSPPSRPAPVATASPPPARELVFETDALRLELGADGVPKSFFQKDPSTEWLAPTPPPLSAVKTGKGVFQVTRLRRVGDLYRADFGAAGVQVDFRITTRHRYLVIEVAKLHGADIREVQLARLAVAPGLDNVGAILVTRWNEQFAVALIGGSDRVHTRIEGGQLVASVYPEFGMAGEKVALVAVPKPIFLNAIQEVERDMGLPSPKIGGKWAKLSDDVRTSYLFTDLTEANADETIRYAKLGGFRYILVYASTWASSLGSYPINLKNFPRGEASLKAVIDKCHAAGLKVGMHMLTSFVGKNDPLVTPKPDPRLLKDAEATLAHDLNETDTQVVTASSLASFPMPRAYGCHANIGSDIQIDDEIIRCSGIAGDRQEQLVQCKRGFAGTRPAPHKQGATLRHLVERYGSYLVDLRSSLKDQVAERVAGLINRAGFDMVYFDGGEVDGVNGPQWYWVGQMQKSIWRRSARPLLLQGSGANPSTWHLLTRITCDDYAAIGTKSWLDHHKRQRMRALASSFMPAELGWWGLLSRQDRHPATQPDEMEAFAARLLAEDVPGSVETDMGQMVANRRTEEMFKRLHGYEALRLSRSVPLAIREQLKRGDWRLVDRNGQPLLYPVQYPMHYARIPGTLRLESEGRSQPFRFRLEILPSVSPGAKENVVLFGGGKPLALAPPRQPMPGALAARIEFPRLPGAPAAIEESARGAPACRAVDLSRHRAVSVTLEVLGPREGGGKPAPVLNFQMETASRMYRDHFVELDFRGRRTLVVHEPDPDRLLNEFPPHPANYAQKMALYTFDYGAVVALNVRWMRPPPTGATVRCQIARVEALHEKQVIIRDLTLTAATTAIRIPGELRTGDSAEVLEDDVLRVFDPQGRLLRNLLLVHQSVTPIRTNAVRLRAAGAATVKLTHARYGEPLAAAPRRK